MIPEPPASVPEAPAPDRAGASLVIPPGIRAAVFDMDGLLLDTEPLWAAAEAELLEGHGGVFTPADAAATHGRSVEASVMAYADRLGGVSWTALYAELLAIMRTAYASGPPVRAGVRALVGALRTRMPLAVATNTSTELVRVALAGADLLESFAVIASAADIGRSKPDPAVYLAACHGLGVAPEHAVAFEDSPTGVRAARAAGLLVVGVPDRAGVDLESAGAHHVVPSLEWVTIVE